MDVNTLTYKDYQLLADVILEYLLEFGYSDSLVQVLEKVYLAKHEAIAEEGRRSVDSLLGGEPA